MTARAPIIASRIQPAKFADVGKCPWCGIRVTMRRDRPNMSCRDCTPLDKAFPRTHKETP